MTVVIDNFFEEMQLEFAKYFMYTDSYIDFDMVQLVLVLIQFNNVAN